MFPEKREEGDDEVLSTLQASFAVNESNARFCTTHVRFIHQRTAWTCSYASLQMSISALQCEPKHREALFHNANIVPNVASIQQRIQRAWKLGFDKEGGEYFHFKLTTQRIGVSDIAAMLRADRIPTSIVDFRKSSFGKVEEFCYQYFFHSNSSKFPLVLGTEDHTVVVVGCEKDKHGRINLIVFDPAMAVRDAKQAAQCTPQHFYARRAKLVRYREFQIGLFHITDNVEAACVKVLVGKTPEAMLAQLTEVIELE